MRELKCRLWDKQEQRMIYPEEAEKSKNLFALGLHGLPIVVDQDSFREDEIVGWNVDHRMVPMLYAGLKDINKKEIYDGDIVLHHGYNLKMIVKWCHGVNEYLGGQLGWMLDNGYYQVDFTADQKYPPKRDYDYIDVTVLGNIYEHPQLLQDMGSFGYDPLTGEQK